MPEMTPSPLSCVVRTAAASLDRRRIWQIDPRMHCSVLGTCLTLNDLHVLGRRARYRLDPATSPYDLHSWFVDMMVSMNDLSKIVDKELEKRHAKAAQIVRRARSAREIEERWKEVAASGAIAGAYWGAMSHPLATTELHWRLFGEIHMLSHLVGSSRRSDLSRVHELEVACAELDTKHAQLKHDHRAALKDRKHLEEKLEAGQRELEHSSHRLTCAHERISALESPQFARELEDRVRMLERRLGDAERRAASAEAELTATRADLDEARESNAGAAARIRELVAENEALEHELEASVACPFATETGAPSAEEATVLCGKRILCVGGRTNLVQHYRALVERRGGEFLHHDGGLEDSLDAVTRAMQTVDAVVCPMDCVSHAASLKVKRACKHLAKPFVPLRSSGLSSFARGIRRLAEPG